MNQEVITQLIREQQPIYLPDNLIERSIWHEFAPLQRNNQVIVIKGMRRCGKSTFMQWVRSQEKHPHFYFNFDDDRLVNFTIADFQRLLELLIEVVGPAKVVYFDEIQNIAGWERFIRRLHDQGYKIYLTGSNARLFSRELGTHLTGRTIAIEMFPYSFSEYLSAKKITHSDHKTKTTEEKSLLKSYFNHFVKMGGIPDYIRFEQPEYLSDLYENILYRDIIVRHNVGKEPALKSLVHYLASNVGKEISYNKLKQMLKLASATTVSDYCYFIEMSYLCFFVNQYSPSLKTQAHYAKKEYFIDQALVQKIGFRISEDQGRMLENIVFLELKRRKQEIYFHKGNKECDFVIKEAHKITQVIQVVMHLDNEDIKQREFAGLKEAMKTYHLKTGLILTDNTEFQQDDIIVMPVWKWLLE
ncbi:MAG: ATPase [Gammaproteobacteria bacterium RIFCSPLOWO2_02_FULL_42_14]|nr:MAG: ATPase [Gammaproteobacteria bacterium RIFCSPHIGHO2_02_FULL_42_43]OGT50877.1 MAG: ATPase [Gammaproteobacteria bacterium RIFCSPHIGHO2_12_FULL_41_25]OGT62528.1 MAG: ATPase [Gammaproteobacteria bacterium RIFCSPLOWO2_02_FULL_42_14]OGT86512.1 MAG: ATPase [Gammaproteobacteria bacterium RIFCSPLOWO2_12_FULL_42_18]